MTVNHSPAMCTQDVAADFLPKISLHKSNVIILDLCLASKKEFQSGKLLSKKENSVWKLLMLVMVSLLGLSMCFVQVGQRALLWRAGSYMPTGITGPRNQCPQAPRNIRGGIRLHYPRPKNFRRSECICTPVHNFVILSMQRSGSGWFETLLNNHPNISSHGEIFAGPKRHANLSVITRRLDKIYNLDYQSSAVKDECTAAVGFKWMFNQGVMEYQRDISWYFQEKGVSVIFLLRWNLLRRLISILANAYDHDVKLLNGTHKSHVHSKQEADMLAAFKPIINHKILPASFRRILQVTQDALQAFNNTRHIVVYYEDLVKNKEKLNHIQQFLGVPVAKLESQQVKIHTQPLSKQVKNWDSVYRALNGTEFETFLTETE